MSWLRRAFQRLHLAALRWQLADVTLRAQQLQRQMAEDPLALADMASHMVQLRIEIANIELDA